MLLKVLALGSLLASKSLVDAAAPVITNNAVDSGYKAELSAGPGSVTGSVEIKSTTNGTGVMVSASWNGFDLADSKEYTYHIHQSRVPDDGNCSSTKGHFDAYGVTDDFACNSAQPDLCQLGDLSGKHGAISFADNSNAAISLSYIENYLSTSPGDAAFFGDLSIVVHRKRDKFRLKCGNFIPLKDTNSTTMPLYPNATTSTEVVATSTVDASGTGPIGTSTSVIQATGSQSAASSSHAASSSGIGVQGSSDGATQGIGEHVLAVVIGMIALVGFA